MSSRYNLTTMEYQKLIRKYEKWCNATITVKETIKYGEKNGTENYIIKCNFSGHPCSKIKKKSAAATENS